MFTFFVGDGVPLASFDFHHTLKIDSTPPFARPPYPHPSRRVLLAKRDSTSRWTSQFNMMDRLLALKKPISEYFRQHPANPRKLSSHEWTVMNEVCSLLDVVSEATIRMQGAKDTHVSQAMFIMTEVIAMLSDDTHPIRVANATVMPPPPAGIPTEDHPGVGPYDRGARRAGRAAGGNGAEAPGEGLPNRGANVRVAGSEGERSSVPTRFVNGSAALRTRARRRFEPADC